MNLCMQDGRWWLRGGERVNERYGPLLSVNILGDQSACIKSQVGRCMNFHATQGRNEVN